MSSQSQRPDIDKLIIESLRQKTDERRKCPVCSKLLPSNSTWETVEKHFREKHPEKIRDPEDGSNWIEKTLQQLKDRRDPLPQATSQPAGTRTNTAANIEPTTTGSLADVARDRRLKSPDSNPNLKSKRDHDESALPTKRTRARAPNPSSATRQPDSDFRREPAQKTGKLWSPDEESTMRKETTDSPIPVTTTSVEPREPREPRTPRPRPDVTEMLKKQPEIRPISQEQLVAEVKGIYAGLVMVESKCIEVDTTQSPATGSRLNSEQWQALIALHRTLLHEHHDFFLASQHPSASPALRRLASKYAMPARMWRHGIHSFLELLRFWLPASLEHMLTFIYLAYSMMALLYETVPSFEDTWIECLGDLGRYRMAIEEEDVKEREIWTSVSRRWYSIASDRAPTTGRLYHHLAILERPKALKQLFYYTKSLCVPIPFTSTRDSIMTLFEPHLCRLPTRLLEIDVAFVRAHGILFTDRNKEELSSSIDTFIGNLDSHIRLSAHRWMENGYCIGIALSCALLEYGSESNVIMRAIKSHQAGDSDLAMEGTDAPPSQKFFDALDFACRTHDIVFRRFDDLIVRPYLHVTLSFLYHLSYFPTAMAHIEGKLPWKLLSLNLNALIGKCSSFEKIESEKFPCPEKESPRPLPEDFAQRGLLWVDKYYPDDWFTAAKIEDGEKDLELASMTQERRDRCLWLGCRLASSGRYLTYDNESRQFKVPVQYDVEIVNLPAGSDTARYTVPEPKRLGRGENGDAYIPDAPAAGA